MFHRWKVNAWWDSAIHLNSEKVFLGGAKDTDVRQTGRECLKSASCSDCLQERLKFWRLRIVEKFGWFAYLT
jgi:hypothetical protein